MEENTNYEVTNVTEETNLTTEQESSGGVGLGMAIGAGLTLAVIGAKKLWDKFGPKKKMGTVSKEEPIDVEFEGEADSEEAAE